MGFFGTVSQFTTEFAGLLHRAFHLGAQLLNLLVTLGQQRIQVMDGRHALIKFLCGGLELHRRFLQLAISKTQVRFQLANTMVASIFRDSLVATFGRQQARKDNAEHKRTRCCADQYPVVFCELQEPVHGISPSR